jgi:hypothetical protein
MSDRLTPRDLGALLHYAMRYALGRMTYAVSDVARLMRTHWHEVDSNGREQIAEDLRLEIQRAERRGKPLGMECDHRAWCELRDWMDKERGK